MFRRRIVLAMVVVGGAFAAGAVGAQGPQPASPAAPLGTAFTYQGQLRQNGVALNGTLNLTFKLYAVASGGAALATVGKAVTATNGFFSTQLDFGSLFDGSERWLGIGVGADPELTPRQLLTAVPYALYARGNWSLGGNAETVPGTNYLGTSDNQPLVFKTNGAEALRIDASGSVGIGTTTPSDKLTVLDGVVHSARTTLMTEEFDAAGFPPAGWTTGGYVNWQRNSTAGYLGGPGAAVTVTSFFTTAFLNLNYTFSAAGQLRFFWKTDTYPDSGFLLFCLDNNSCTSATGYNQRITGRTEWAPVSVPVSAGAHNFRWVLASSTPIWGVGERGWLDRVQVMAAGGDVVADGTVLADRLYVTRQSDFEGYSRFQGLAAFEGKVGIGMSNPVQLLHVNVLTGAGEGIEIDSPVAGHAPAIYLNHTGNLGRNFRVASYGDNVTDGSFRIRDDTSGADRILIDSAGRVGINTIAPSRTLEVNGVIGVYDAAGRGKFGGMATEGGAAMINFGLNDDDANRFGGTYNSVAQGGLMRVDTRAGLNLFQFLARPAMTTTAVNEVFGISGKGSVRAAIGAGQRFSLGGAGTFEIDAPFIPAGRFYVDDAGHVGIGHNAPTRILQIQQNSTTDPIADAWTTYSSRRWKSDIATIEGALDKVERLRGVTYDWTANGKHDIGFVAEEVGQVVPEVVVYEENGVDAQSVDYGRLVALLVEATKEQQRQIETQRDEMAALRARLDTLERRGQIATGGANVPDPGIASLLNSGNLSLAGLLGAGILHVLRRRKAG